MTELDQSPICSSYISIPFGFAESKGFSPPRNQRPHLSFIRLCFSNLLFSLPFPHSNIHRIDNGPRFISYHFNFSLSYPLAFPDVTGLCKNILIHHAHHDAVRSASSLVSFLGFPLRFPVGLLTGLSSKYFRTNLASCSSHRASRSPPHASAY